MTTPFRIVFMGTPDFAVPTLQSLHASAHDVVMVVTQEDRPKGRGRKTQPTPIKTVARELGYTVIQPGSVNTADVTDALARARPDFLVVVAFGQILRESVLEIPRIGPVNVHASLLPKYRGAAPIQWAVINNERRTGVTTILMDKGMDTDNILLSTEEPIGAEDTAADLHDRLARIGSRLLVETLDRYAAGTVHPVAQDHSQATYAPMLKKSDGRIAWHQPAESVAAHIRGVDPWPGAYTYVGNRRLRIFRARAVSEATAAAAGTVVLKFPDELLVAAGKGLVAVLEVQSESGKRLKIEDFLRGHPIPPGTVLT
jgi:methionyl-tRNA formyltransferase